MRRARRRLRRQRRERAELPSFLHPPVPREVVFDPSLKRAREVASIS